MSYEIKADHSQIFLLPPAIEDWVANDHPVRFIREFVLGLDLAELGFSLRKAADGRPNYSAELLLGVWLYGYFEKIRSTRKLEKACRAQMPLIWLTGMQYPDHNTLWRFWNVNQAAIKQVFRKSVLLADNMKMIEMVLAAVDGTKIKAVSSDRTSWTEKRLKEKLKLIQESIELMDKQIQESIEQDKHLSSRLPEAFQQKLELSKAVEKGLEELAQSEKKTSIPLSRKPAK